MIDAHAARDWNLLFGFLGEVMQIAVHVFNDGTERVGVGLDVVQKLLPLQNFERRRQQALHDDVSQFAQRRHKLVSRQRHVDLFQYLIYTQQPTGILMKSS